VRIDRLGMAVRVPPRALRLSLVLWGLTVVAVGVALCVGDVQIGVADVVRTVLGRGSTTTDYVVNQLRLPRALDGVLVGAALGAAGAVFQSLSRNPLGSPDLVGFTRGSATGALVLIIAVGGTTLAVAAASILGGLVTATLVYLLAFRGGGWSYRLILVGIGVSSVLAALNAFLITRAETAEAQRAAVWLTGSLNGRGWEHFWPLLAALVVLVPAAVALGPRLRLKELGDDAALELGLDVRRARLQVVAIGVGLAAVATAVAGPIAFVALSAPHLARRVGRLEGPAIGPAMAMGALLLVASDVLASRILAPTQLPVGVVTGLLGGIYLVWLLATEVRGGSR
jgi:iron complex transport system permease protein